MNIDTDKIVNFVSVYGLKLLGALAILVLGWWAISIAVTIAKRALTAAKIDGVLISFIGSILYVLGLTFVIIAALGQLGIQTTPLAAVIGAAGLAIALSLQGSLGNLASGVMLIALRPFKIGDHIETAGKDGKVIEINIFTTSLRTDNGQRVIVPNGKITSDVIVNRNG